MRVSVSWLVELLPGLAQALAPAPVGTEAFARAIAAKLTGVGLEVEGIAAFGAGIEGVLVAEVASVRPHPSKSGLRLVTVNRGGGLQEVVCGAPNVPDAGGLVVLAPLGVHLPQAAGGAGLTIAPRAIAGVTSEGMLCSERELGLAFGQKISAGKGESAADDQEGHGGIVILPPGLATPGTKLVDAIPTAQDFVLEVGVTPNRPDALGHVGVARDLAAVLELPFVFPALPEAPAALDVETASVVTVRIAAEAETRATEYLATAVHGVTIAPAPLWLRYRLHALGVRSISNVVDVTNLLMLQFGQPLHAFDLDRLAGAGIQVRLARQGEPIRTLDGASHTLVADDLLICDGAPNGGAPTALAGVMGGGDSEIHDGTKRVLIECACFDPRSVRRTARRHGLHTESSHRFERGVDGSRVGHVSAAATALIASLGGGRPTRGTVRAGVPLPPRTRISFRPERVSTVIGQDIAPAESLSILQRLGCEIVRPHAAPVDGELVVIEVPAHRPDLAREIDLVEEVVRMRGIDRVPTIRPSIPPQALRRAGGFEQAAREVAASLGLSEAVNFAFASRRELSLLGAPEAAVALANPLGEERAVLRTTLLPGLLSALRRSRNRGERRVQLFEVGARFLAGGAEAAFGLCDEVPTFAAVLAGPRDSWLGRGDEVDVFDAKGVVEALVSKLVSREVTCALFDSASRPRHLHPRGASSVSIVAEGREIKIGSFGPLHPDVVDALELDGGAQVIELDLRALESIGGAVVKYAPLPTMQSTFRDVALELDEAVQAGAVVAALSGGAGPLCQRVEVFDVYRGKGVAAGRKSIAVRLTYRDPADARTLTDVEVDRAHAAAVAAAASLGAAQRG